MRLEVLAFGRTFFFEKISADAIRGWQLTLVLLSYISVAVALEKALDIPADIRMNLQTQYDLDTANIAERDNQRETIAVTIPVRDCNLLRELVRKFGWASML